MLLLWWWDFRCADTESGGDVGGGEGLGWSVATNVSLDTALVSKTEKKIVFFLNPGVSALLWSEAF